MTPEFLATRFIVASRCKSGLVISRTDVVVVAWEQVSCGTTTTKNVFNISCSLRKKRESACKVSTLDHRCLILSGKTSVWIIARLISLPAVPFLI